MPYEDLMLGFWKWKERTTTSPSGRQLGIYKALLKDNHRPKKKTTTAATKPPVPLKTSPTVTTTKAPERNGADVMQMIHKLLVMAVRHCHTFDRWTKIWNLFIEKDIGNPQIDRLQTLRG